jgi:hypothetical protein
VAKTTKRKSPSQPYSKTFAAIRKEAERERKRDLVAKWKALQRLGAYQSKVSAAQSRLTSSRIKAIEKTFKEIQRHGKSVAGRVVRPLSQVSILTPKGNIKKRYDTSGYFDFVRSKIKTDLKTGVIKTRKGYIVEKTRKDAKVKINKKGEIIETIKGLKRKLKLYRGQDVLQMLKDMESGKLKLQEKELILIKKWGSPDAVIHLRENSGLLIEGRYWLEFLGKNPQRVIDSFLKHTVIERITEK